MLLGLLLLADHLYKSEKNCQFSVGESFRFSYLPHLSLSLSTVSKAFDKSKFTFWVYLPFNNHLVVLSTNFEIQFIFLKTRSYNVKYFCVCVKHITLCKCLGS